MRPLDELLTESGRIHGHTCAGQVLGVRMAMLGCASVGVEDPLNSKRLLVWVEIDRCAADAIQAVTGCKLGKRTLKFVDYGKVAAAFLNTETGEAVRVAAREDSRDAALRIATPGTSKKDAQLMAYREMPDALLFSIKPIRLSVPDSDLPGPPRTRVTCGACGEGVNDGREVATPEGTLCRACAGGAYYTVVGPFTAREAAD